MTRLTPSLSLTQGDIFDSGMQTLTIPVNTKGVMGKGLALTTKRLFPDVYVKYKEVCESKILSVSTPSLYKRDDGAWFLLFATKEHWRSGSQIQYIIDGMNWLKANYMQLGIRSLALPALGCGLGGLDWADVGPIVCTTASQMDIPICVYLPADMTIPGEQLQADYLIRS